MRIEGNDNIQSNGDNNIIGNGNTVNNHFYSKKRNDDNSKEKGEMPFSVKVYRRRVFIVDAIFIAICFGGLLVSPLYKLGFEYIIPFLILVYLGWHFLPMKMYSLYVSVYSDRLSIGNKDIMFNDIREWKSFGNTFTYIFHDDDIEHTIEFYSHNKPKYICYRIEKFCSFYGIEYRNYKI